MPDATTPVVSAELLEQLGDAVTVIGPDWRYRFVSTGAATIIGRPAGDVVGEQVWDVFPEVVGSPQHAAVVRAMDERVAVKIVWFFDTVGRWYEQQVLPVDAGLVVVVDDVTEREQDAERAEQLLGVADELAQAMSVDEVAAVAQQEALPLLGAVGGALVLVDEGYGVARSVGWVGLDERVRSRWGTFALTTATPSLDAYRTGEPVVVEDITEARDRYPDLVDSLAANGPRTVVAFPLVSAGRSLGALVAHFPLREVSPRDRSFIATVAAMCAQALTRARLFDAEQRSIEALQQHLLPRVVPEVPGVELGVLYESSESTVNIGGDWFDVVVLPGGAVGLVIGDVEGHDVEAAAFMGLVRSAVRAYALDGLPPALILDRANRFLAGLHVHRLVTVAYLQLQPREHLVIAASAGHLRTLCVAPDGTVDEVPVTVGPPLGVVDAELRWPETTSAIPADATLAMFTDGLVEDAGADIDVGLGRVRAALVGSIGRPARDVAAALVAARPSQNDDDVAVLVAHVTATDVDPSRRSVRRLLPPTPASVFIARRFVNHVVALWSVPQEVAESVELAVSELVTNAARHSEDSVDVRLARPGDVLRIEVGDSSHRMPRGGEQGDLDMTSGRGLFLVEAVSDRWGVDSTGLGKTVWCEFDLAGAFPAPA